MAEKIKDGFYINNIKFNTFSFTDEKVIIAPSQDNLQKDIYIRKLSIKYTDYNMVISTDKTKVSAFKGKTPV
jgi:hypothetical protein